MTRALLILTVGAAVGAACSAFADYPEQQRCMDIPAGGCPGAFDGDGGGCSDVTCSAIYACDPDGGWVLTMKCPGRPDAGASDGQSPHDASDALTLHDADWDVPPGAYGGSSCIDLQPTCCSLGLVLSCPANECCGCQSLFICDDGGWNVWGQCLDGGTLMQTPPFPDDL